MQHKTSKYGTKPPVNAAGSGSTNKQTTRHSYQDRLTEKVRNRGKKQYEISLKHDQVALRAAFVEEYGDEPEAALVAYLRVSTAPQDDDDKTALEDQLREIADHAAKDQQAMIAGIFVDVASGMHVDRQGLQAMIMAAEAEQEMAA